MMPLSSSTILDGLNDDQKLAVTTTEGPLLVVAGPGTGKTLTIVRRIAYLVSLGVRPENILAVTFTSRAAREMKERTEALLGEAASRIFIGTFHLLGLRIIRENRNADFSILGRDEQIEVLKSFMKGTAKNIQQTAERISRIKNFLEEESNPSQPSFEKGENLKSPPLENGDRGGLTGLQEVLHIYQAYESILQQRNAYDFDDLIRGPIELLEQKEIAGRYRQQFKYVLVDEYQDINPAQYRLLRRLTGEGGNVCAVGDADQAIYAFRGGDVGNFLEFERNFPHATRITLTRNYRSTQTIVSAADSVIRNNKKRIEKNVIGTKESGGPLSVVSVPDDRTEGATIIQEIEARIGGTSHSQIRQMRPGAKFEASYRFSDFAVIYRTNAQAKAFEDAFTASGIPYQVIGKRGRGQRKEIEETVAFLQTLADPRAVQELQDDKKTIEEKLLSEADFFDPRADAVTLMTMHMAKGLEFRVVFITGCEDGLAPCTIIKDDADIEEERRLFYVGMTRAREELFLTHARKRFLYGESLGRKCSPFLDEIPDGVKESAVVADKIKKQEPEDKQMGLF